MCERVSVVTCVQVEMALGMCGGAAACMHVAAGWRERERAAVSMRWEVAVCTQLEETGCVRGGDAACQGSWRGGSRVTRTCEGEQTGVWGEEEAVTLFHVMLGHLC